MRINVTQQNISDGLSCSAQYCPIALAIKDLYPDAAFISVGVVNAFIAFNDSDKDYPSGYFLPYDAQSFVKNFDLGLDVDPFTFTLE